VLPGGTKDGLKCCPRSNTLRSDVRGIGRNFLRDLEALTAKWETAMDWNRIEGNWKQVKGKVKEKWGKLTDDELDKMNGRRDQLEGKIQERYGIAKDQAKKDVDNWFSTLKW
jgi:uncharacterized protein YjbJ (UPF0337 family)